MKPIERPFTGLFLCALFCSLGSGCVVGVVDLDGDDGPWDKEASEVSIRTLPVTTQLGIRFTAVNGEVAVVGEAGAQEVTIRATKRVLSHSLADAEAHLSDIDVRVHSDRGEIRLETYLPDHTGNRGYAVDYEITVPEEFFVTGVNANGNLYVEGVRSCLNLDLGNGNVTLLRVEGSARVTLGNGNLTASVILPPGEDIFFQVGNGSAVLTLQPDVSAELQAHVGNGTIVVSGLTLVNPVSGSNSFWSLLGTGEGSVELTVGNGNIRVNGG